MQWIIYVKIFTFLIVATNAFWWGSSSSSTNEEEDEIKPVPYHVFRTLTYHPVLIPAQPPAPMANYQYARGYFPPNPSHTQSQPTPQPSAVPPPITATPTTARTRTTPLTTTTTSTTTTSTTTTEPPTTAATQAQHEPVYTAHYPYKQAAKSNISPEKGNPFSNEFSGTSSFLHRSPSETTNLQYVTNIAPMNVQFVPCMCPVEVRISNEDSQQEKHSDDSYIHRDFNNLDENVD